MPIINKKNEKKITINIPDNNNIRNIKINDSKNNQEQNIKKDNDTKIVDNQDDKNIRNIKIYDSNSFKNKEQNIPKEQNITKENNNKLINNKKDNNINNNNKNITKSDYNKNKEQKKIKENDKKIINSQETNNNRNTQTNDLKKNKEQNLDKEKDKKIINKQDYNTEVNNYKKNEEEQNKNKENDNKVINNQETKNYRSIGIGNTNERTEVKLSNKPENKKKTDFTLNRDQFFIKSNNKHVKKKNILKVKSNDKITIINKKPNNNSNESNINNKNKEEKRIYKISSNVVNEQYYKDKFIEKEIDSDDENYLTISMQSLNDSNIMEIANRYITEEEDLDKNEVNIILNTKKERLI